MLSCFDSTQTVDSDSYEFEFEFWCLTPFSAIFQLYHGDQF